MVANKEAKNGKVAALLKFCLALLAVAFGFAANAENPDATRKRFVLFGYEFGRSKASPPTPLLETASRFKDVGIDGLGLYLPSKEMPDGRKLVSPMDDPFAWRYEDFAADAPLYRQAFEKAGLRFNFLKTFFCAPRKHIDWDDDASWERVASTMRALAKFAKAAGFKGLCADHEDYHRSSQFDRRKNEPEFDELAKMVRLRGRQVFSGVFEEFPDAELFFYWFLGWRDRHFTCRDTEGGLRDNGELWPAFANGILDVLPSKAKIIDGDEWAYYHAEKEYFARSYNFRRTAVLGMVAPENRDKYRLQTSMGFGLYTDMYVNPQENRFYRAPTDGSRLKTFSGLIAEAAKVSDEYVWFWNEKVQWVKWTPAPQKYNYANTCLEEFMPGLRAACDAARSADGFIERREKALASKGLLENVLAESTWEWKGAKPKAGELLSYKGESVPKPWSFVRPASVSNGVAGVLVGGGIDGGTALVVKGVSKGSFTYRIKNASPGDYWVLKVAAKGPANITLYPFSKGKIPAWYHEMSDIYIAPFGKPDEKGWKRAEALICIPDGIDEFMVDFGWRHQEGESTLFSDFVLERLVWFEPDSPDPSERLVKSKKKPAKKQDAVSNAKNSKDSVPVMRIAVMSDIQGHPYAEDAGMRNLERALDVLAPFKPDIVLNNGDINDSGRDSLSVAYYKARCDARLGKIPHIACMGNHEIGFVSKELRKIRTSDVIRSEFNSVFGYAPDEQLVHRVLGGYDFIALSLDDPSRYKAHEIEMLKAALDKAVKRDSRKPIFVLTHYHPKDTVNSSDNANQGGDMLRNLLNAYPQAVSISGHTHNPLQDPRSIWQGEFTAVDTSTLCYGCVALNPPAENQISCLIPYGHESVGCMLLEVYADRLVFRRFSVRNRREIEPQSPWTVPWPHNPSSAPYSFASRWASEKAPQFASDVEPTVWYDYGYVFLMFNAVADTSSVFGYRIELTPEGGEAKSYFQLSDYYRIPEHRQNRVVFRTPPGSLLGGVTYRCRIFPVGFFGAEGKPVDWGFTVGKTYRCRREKPNCVQE